jgi:hypothetical protein
MKCCFWFDPPEESKKYIKKLCENIVEEVKELEKQGDPVCFQIKDIKKLIDNLYNPESYKKE